MLSNELSKRDLRDAILDIEARKREDQLRKQAQIARDIRLGKRKPLSNVVAFPEPKANPQPTSVKGRATAKPLAFDSPYIVVVNGNTESRPLITIQRIQDVVAAHFRVSKLDLVAERRTKLPSWARQVAFYLCRTLTPFSFPRIGRAFGGRDHTTVCHGYRKVVGFAETDPKLAEELSILEHKIRNGEGA